MHYRPCAWRSVPPYSWGEQNNSFILFHCLDGVQHLQGRDQKRLLEVCADGQSASKSPLLPPLQGGKDVLCEV